MKEVDVCLKGKLNSCWIGSVISLPKGNILSILTFLYERLEDLADFFGALLRVSLLAALIIHIRDAESSLISLCPLEVASGQMNQLGPVTSTGIRLTPSSSMPYNPYNPLGLPLPHRSSRSHSLYSIPT